MNASTVSVRPEPGLTTAQAESDLSDLSDIRDNHISDVRFELLVRLVKAVRNVAAITELSERQLSEAVEDWNDVLLEVPTEMLQALRRDGLQRGLRKADEFFEMFRAHQAEKQLAAFDAERERQDHRWHRLAQSGQLQAGPGFQAAQLQRARWEAGLCAVACGCVNFVGLHTPAQLSPDRRMWVCAARSCAWTWPVSDTANAPSRGTPGPMAQAVQAASVPQSQRVKRQLSYLETVAEACNIDLERCDELTTARLSGFCNWWRETYDCCTLTRELLDEHYPKWITAHDPAVLRE